MPTAEPKPEARRRPAAGKQPVWWSRRLIHWLLVFVACAIIVDGLVGERGLLAMMQARHDYDELSAAIDRQRAGNSQLREQIRRLTEDPAAIEEIARRELGLIRPGERVFIIKDVQPAKQ